MHLPGYPRIPGLWHGGVTYALVMSTRVDPSMVLVALSERPYLDWPMPSVPSPRQLATGAFLRLGPRDNSSYAFGIALVFLFLFLFCALPSRCCGAMCRPVWPF